MADGVAQSSGVRCIEGVGYLVEVGVEGGGVTGRSVEGRGG